MAISSLHFLAICTLLFSLSTAQTSFRPKALVLKVTKDASTRQYLTTIATGTPLSPAKLALDLGGEFLWLDCDAPGLNSSSRRPVSCRSAQCNLVSGFHSCTEGRPDPNICYVSPINTVTGLVTGGDFSRDVASARSTDGSNPGRPVSVPNFLLTCAPKFHLEGLAPGVVGIAGIGRVRSALPQQFSAAFSFPRKHAVCLSPSDGFVIFGDGPYVVSPKFDVAKALTYTPLVRSPSNYLGGFSEYFIGVKSIKIAGKPVPINATLLAIDSEGKGGAKISSVNPYGVLETSIYNAVVTAFAGAFNAARVAAVAPFGACFSSKGVGVTRAGPAVPPIDLVLQEERVVWRILGSNSMVRVSSDVLCLGFVDGGPVEFVHEIGRSTRTAIIIGGHQIEDNLLQFDLASSRLGFSSSLLTRTTSCSNFNFTSVA